MSRKQSHNTVGLLLCTVLGLLTGCSDQPTTPLANQAPSFTLAVIPDTQNYVDYSHQLNEGFALERQQGFYGSPQPPRPSLGQDGRNHGRPRGTMADLQTPFEFVERSPEPASHLGKPLGTAIPNFDLLHKK